MNGSIKKLLVIIGVILLIVFLITLELAIAFFSVVFDLYFPKYKGWEEYDIPEIQTKPLVYHYDVPLTEKSLNLSFDLDEVYYNKLASVVFDGMLSVFQNLFPTSLSKEKIAKIVKIKFGLEDEDYTLSYLSIRYYANTPNLKFFVKGLYKGQPFELSYLSSMPCDIGELGCDESFLFVTNSKQLLYKVASSLCGYADFYKKGLGKTCMGKVLYKDGDTYAICFELEGYYRKYSVNGIECSSLEG